MKRQRLTPEEWREVEARYQALCWAQRDLFHSLQGRACGRALAPLCRIDSKLGEVGLELENEALRQHGTGAPRFPREPRAVFSAPVREQRPTTQIRTPAKLSSGSLELNRRPA